MINTHQNIYLNIALPCLAWLIEYSGVSSEKLLILMILMGFDTLSGSFAAFACKEDITARRFAVGVLSKVIVLFIPLTFGLMAHGVDLNARPFVSFCMSLLIVAEAYSVVGNVYMLKTGKRVREIDAIGALLRIIQKIFYSLTK